MNSTAKNLTKTNFGEYQQAIDAASAVIDGYFKFAAIDREIFAEGCRIIAWAFYYLAIKGDQSEKNNNALHAELYAREAIALSEDDNRRLSALNVLPLAIHIQGSDRRSAAWRASDKAIQEFPQEPSVWNTRGILARWSSNNEVGMIIGAKVTKCAIDKGDSLTAGHGAQNRGDALDNLNHKEEALKAYELALRLYLNHEAVTGVKATPHIESVKKKIASRQ